MADLLDREQLDDRPPSAFRRALPAAPFPVYEPPAPPRGDPATVVVLLVVGASVVLGAWLGLHPPGAARGLPPAAAAPGPPPDRPPNSSPDDPTSLAPPPAHAGGARGRPGPRAGDHRQAGASPGRHHKTVRELDRPASRSADGRTGPRRAGGPETAGGRAGDGRPPAPATGGRPSSAPGDRPSPAGSGRSPAPAAGRPPVHGSGGRGRTAGDTDLGHSPAMSDTGRSRSPATSDTGRSRSPAAGPPRSGADPGRGHRGGSDGRSYEEPALRHQGHVLVRQWCDRHFPPGTLPARACHSYLTSW